MRTHKPARARLPRVPLASPPCPPRVPDASRRVSPASRGVPIASRSRHTRVTLSRIDRGRPLRPFFVGHGNRPPGRGGRGGTYYSCNKRSGYARVSTSPPLFDRCPFGQGDPCFRQAQPVGELPTGPVELRINDEKAFTAETAIRAPEGRQGQPMAGNPERLAGVRTRHQPAHAAGPVRERLEELQPDYDIDRPQTGTPKHRHADDNPGIRGPAPAAPSRNRKCFRGRKVKPGLTVRDGVVIVGVRVCCCH